MESDLDRPVVYIDGAEVSFIRRDIRFATDRELQILKDLVRSEQKHEGPNRMIQRLIVMTDHLDRDTVRFKTTVLVQQEVSSSEAESSAIDEGKS